jgi:hypothetical protein
MNNLKEEVKLLTGALNAVGYHVIKIDLEQILNDNPDVKLWVRKDYEARQRTISQSPHSKRRQSL